MKRIDAHLHLAKIVAGYCRRGESRAIGGGKAQWGNGEIFQLIPPELGDMDFTAEQALAVMNQNEVEKAVLMQGSLYGFQNQYHYEILQKYPERFCPTCTVDPFMLDHMRTLQHYLEEQHFHAVKFEASTGGGLMGLHEPFSLSGGRMMEVFKLIEANHGVVALDVGDITMESHQPWAIAMAADQCQNLKFVICHLLAPMRGREEEWKLSLELLNKKNVWFDISSMPKIMTPDVYPYPVTADYLAQAKEILGAKKLLWGTDAPFAATHDSYEHLTDYLEKNGAFTEEELEDVYYHNADQVYFK